jgi:hypothetical protein
MIVVVDPSQVGTVLDAAKRVGVDGWVVGSIGRGEGVTYA